MTVVPTTPITRYNFVLIDLTTDATPDSLRPAASFARIIEALDEQVTIDFADAHGMLFVKFRVGTVDDREKSEIAIFFRDTIPEAPGALAYHQVVAGVPDIEVGCDLFTTVTDGPESISGGVSHEVLETLLDPGANLWADKQDGSGMMAAREACDAVQNTGYLAENGVWVSNFVLPAYFIPGSTGPWDYLKVMQSAADISNGYEIQAPSPSSVSHVGGHNILHNVRALTKKGIERKSRPTSRTYRRGVRL